MQHVGVKFYVRNTVARKMRISVFLLK